MKSWFTHFRGNFFGGLTAGIVALPLALAFGVSSGLGPSAGLYGAIFISFFAALFGGTATQISGPTAPMTAVSMVVISGLIATYDGEVDKALPAILTVFLLAGLLQIALGSIGVGKYIKYIPYPVISGFMTAIGVMILLTQLLPALGYTPKDDQEFVRQFVPEAEAVVLKKIVEQEATAGVLVLDDLKNAVVAAQAVSDQEIQETAVALAKKKASGVWGALRSLPRALRHINYLELLLCLATIALIYGFKKITTAVPSTLVALVVVTGVAYGFGLAYRPIAAIPSGFPIPNFEIVTQFHLSKVLPYFFTALSLAFLGAIDSLLTSVIADNMTKTKHEPNRELIGQGIGNSIAAIFGGIPGAGATIRTVVNINAGGKTKLSGMIASIVLLLVMLLLGPVASKIPAAVLAGILITVGIGVMDYKGLKAIPYMPKVEVIIMVVVLLLSVFWDLVYAVGIGLVLSSLLFMKKMGDVTAQTSMVKSLQGFQDDQQLEYSKEALWGDEAGFPECQKDQLFIKHLSGPLFFGATREVHDIAEQIPDTASDVIIRMDKVPYMDQSGLYTLEDILLALHQKGIAVYMVGVQQQPKYLLKRIDIIPDLVPETAIFKDFKSCIEHIRETLPSSDC